MIRITTDGTGGVGTGAKASVQAEDVTSMFIALIDKLDMYPQSRSLDLNAPPGVKIEHLHRSRSNRAIVHDMTSRSCAENLCPLNCSK